jgi:hypothetical protein
MGNVPPQHLARRALLYSVLIIVFLPLACAQELPEIDVKFIPENFSVGSGFIMIADPGVYYQSIRVSYLQEVFEPWFWGSLPRFDETRWVCYFSNTDENATCGPNPFDLVGEYIVKFFSINKDGSEGNATVVVNVGELTLDSSDTVLNGNRLTMSVFVVGEGQVSGGVRYDVYSKKNVTKLEELSGILEYNPPTQGYIGNVTLSPGSYYVAFTAVEGDKIGGDIFPVTVGVEEYFDGGDYIPSYDLKVDSFNKSIVIYSDDSYSVKNLRIINLGNESIGNLTVSVPSHISKYLSFNLENDTVEGESYIFYTATVRNVDSGMHIKDFAYLESDETKVAAIPLDLKISVKDACPDTPTISPTPGNALSISPFVWRGEYMTTGGEKEFTLKNNGDEEINDFSYDTQDISIIDSIDFPERLDLGRSNTMTVKLKTASPGSYAGTIIINTNIGSEILIANIDVYRNISGDIETERDLLREKLDSILDPSVANALSDIAEGIENDLDDAEREFALENYASGMASYDIAKAKLYMFDDTIRIAESSSSGPSPDTDMSGLIVVIIVIVIVAIVGIVLFMFKDKILKLFEKGESEEEELEIEKELEGL